MRIQGSVLKMFLQNTILSVISVVFSLIVIEIGYRAYIYTSYTEFRFNKLNFAYFDKQLYEIDQNLKPEEGPYRKDIEFRRYYVLADNTIAQISEIHTNNLGWLSRYDYSLDKDASEFRIVIIGDSQTGSHTDDKSWVDRLQELLDSDPSIAQAMGVKRVTIYNIGKPGLPFRTAAGDRVEVAQLFSPDLVISHYFLPMIMRKHPDNLKDRQSYLDSIANTIADTERTDIEANAEKQEIEQIWRNEIDWFCGDKKSDVGRITVGGTSFRLRCTLPPRDICNPLCVPLAAAWFNTAGETAITPDYISQQKKLVSKATLKPFLLKSRAWHSLNAAMGKPFSRETLPLSITPAVRSAEEDKEFKIWVAEKTVKESLEKHDNLIFVRYAGSNELVGGKKYDYDEGILEIVPDSLPVILMRPYLPIEGKSKAELSTWYNLPHDGHMSNKGAQIYAEAFHRMLKEKLPRIVQAIEKKKGG